MNIKTNSNMKTLKLSNLDKGLLIGALSTAILLFTVYQLLIW